MKKLTLLSLLITFILSGCIPEDDDLPTDTHMIENVHGPNTTLKV